MMLSEGTAHNISGVFMFYNISDVLIYLAFCAFPLGWRSGTFSRLGYENVGLHVKLVPGTKTCLCRLSYLEARKRAQVGKCASRQENVPL